MLSSTAYVKLVDIAHGATVNRDTVAVRSLITAGLVHDVAGHLEVVDADAFDAAVAEREAHDERAMRRFRASLGLVGVVPEPDRSSLPDTRTILATTAARWAA